MNTRMQIVQAMIELAAREGYAQCSRDRVARAAGVSRASFDAHFGTREQCLAAAQAHVTRSLSSYVRRALEGGEPCSALAGGLFDFAAREGDGARLLLCESLAAGEPSRRRRDRLIASIAAALEARWRSEAGRLRGPDLPAQTLVAVIFRVLACTLRSQAREPALVRAGVLAWADAYVPKSGRYRWRTPARPYRPALVEAPKLARTLPSNGSLASEGDTADGGERLRIMQGVALAAYWHDLVNVGVGDVLRAAGLARSVFDRHFSGVEAAAVAALELSYETAMGSASRAFFAEGSWPERVWAASLAASAHGGQHPALAHLAYVEPHALAPWRFEAVRQRVLVATLLVEEGFRASAAAAMLPRIVAEILAMGVFELAYAEAPRRSAQRLPRLAAQRAYVMLAPFLGPEQASELVTALLGGEARA